MRLHPRTFILENTDSFAALEELVGLFVVERNGVRVDLHAIPLLHNGDGVFDEGKRFQAEEVHLEQPRILHHGIVKLGAPHLTVLGERHRDIISDVAGRDDHPTGVDAGIAHTAFHRPCLIDHIGFEPTGIGQCDQFFGAQVHVVTK